MNILVVRPDRIGDVILSTPVFEVIKRHYPKSELTVLLRHAVSPLIRGLPSVDDTFIYEPERRHAGLRGFFLLVRQLRARKFRIAIVLQSNWKIAAALFIAGIRYRIGPLSKPHSFLFYNRGVRQRRSQVEMHEVDYNLQLLRRLGIRVGSRNVSTRVHVSEESKAAAKLWLTENGWDSKSSLILVHPGMGGSALNWPETHYLEFIRALVRDGRQVLVTAGPTEGSLLARIREGLGQAQEKVIFYGGKDSKAVDFLAGLCSWVSLAVAPSTGPLHLAVALGRPVVTFYPPIRVQSAIRWGPYRPEDSSTGILVPDVYCGQDFECLGNLCNYFPCMRSLSVSLALDQANRLIERSSRAEKGESQP